MRRLRWLTLGLSACANLAGIEAGHLRDDTSFAGTAGATQSGAAGASGADATAGGNAGAAASAGWAPVGGGSAGQPTTAGQGQGGGSNGSSPNAGAAGGSSGGSNTEPCPSGMIQSFSEQGSAYCIDAYEVTNAQYLGFTQAHTPQNTGQPSACTSNQSFMPDSACGGVLGDLPSVNLPVVCVDWCDADAYCRSAGKRLCGRMGGTHNPPADQANADASEWYAACAGPNDAVRGGELCNDSQFEPNTPGPKAASKLPDCEAELGGVFNLSGNVAEWENSCASTAVAALCNVRGGSFQDGPYELECKSANSAARTSAANSIGIRCCADRD